MRVTTTFTPDFDETHEYRVTFTSGYRYYAVVDSAGIEIAQFEGDAAGHQHAYELAATLNSDAARAAAVTGRDDDPDPTPPAAPRVIWRWQGTAHALRTFIASQRVAA